MGTSADEYFFNGSEGTTGNIPAPTIDFPAEGSEHFVTENNNYKGSENVKRFSVNNLLQLAADCHLGNKSGELILNRVNFIISNCGLRNIFFLQPQN